MKALQPSDIGLILSYQCQAGCDHCLYNCGPGWHDWMEVGAVEEALRSMLLWEGPFQVHFTGGEPFLNFSLLLQAVETATRLGIPRYVETNAGWCMREQLVRERLKNLKSAGLQMMLISCSPFHAARIPAERTLLAIRIARDIFGPEKVIVYLLEWAQQLIQFGSHGITPLSVYEELLGREQAGRLLWEGYGLISGGRSGYRLGHLTPLVPASSFRGHACAQELLFAHHSHFDLYGNFIPAFCGGLRLGDWRNLKDMLQEIRRGMFLDLIRVLIEGGPYQLAQWAQTNAGYEPIPEGYAGKCHLCVDVRKHLATCKSYPELQPPEFYSNF